jgi:hypothetical protein
MNEHFLIPLRKKTIERADEVSKKNSENVDSIFGQKEP